MSVGRKPRCVLEIPDHGVGRLTRIIGHLQQCAVSIHDLSRVGVPARFNMPFELGIFFSAKHFGEGAHKRKQCIILEKTKYRYRKYISDISGVDVTAHKNSAKTAIVSVRNWLVTSSRRKSIPPGEEISRRFQKFQRDIRKICRQRGISYESMPFIEMTRNMSDWLNLNQLIHQPLFQ